MHVVTSGDNLSYIGKKYGVSYKVIKDFNKLKSNRLKLKQKLIIPIIGKSTRKINSRHYYMVKRGDSLESISKSYTGFSPIYLIDLILIHLGMFLKWLLCLPKLCNLL